MNYKQIKLRLAQLFMLFSLCILLIICFVIGSVGYGFHPSLLVWIIALFSIPFLFVYLAYALPKFKIWKRRLTVVLTFIFLMYVVLTGGIFFGSNENVYFSPIYGVFDNALGHDEGSTSIHVDTEDGFIIPLICYIHYPKKPPYAIDVYIFDRARTLNRICIETVCINYGDSKREYELNWDKKISVGYDAYVDSIPGIIEQVKSCDIELSGYFTYFNGDIKRFRTHDRFEQEGSYPDTGWNIYTLWSGLP